MEKDGLGKLLIKVIRHYNFIALCCSYFPFHLPSPSERVSGHP